MFVGSKMYVMLLVSPVTMAVSFDPTDCQPRSQGGPDAWVGAAGWAWG